MENHEKINKLFQATNTKATVVKVQQGLRTNKYHINLEIGEKVSKIKNLSEELALLINSISSPSISLDTLNGHVVIEATTTNKPIEIKLEDLLPKVNLDEFHLPLVLGQNMLGETEILDLATIPHILIGGTTGSGKSVLMRTMINSMIHKYDDSDLKLILIDPKGTELREYKNLKHCLNHTSNFEDYEDIFSTLVDLMEARYRELQKTDKKEFIDLRKPGTGKNPFVVVVIDELADILLQDKKKKIRNDLIRLLQKSRAAGIHFITNTQRPSREIVDGAIKTNMPVRIALKVATRFDSRVILGDEGAEKLVGRGDMLLKNNGIITRIQGAI